MLAVLKIVCWAAGMYLALVATVWFFQRRLQYFPDPSEPELPSEEGAAGLREVELTSADGLRLEAWHWPGERALTVLMLHGNAGHRGHRLDWMRDLRSLGLGVFVLDYRGFGGSEGSPSEAGLRLDARAAVEWLERNAPGERVYFGESLGAGVALAIAGELPPSALILQSGSACFVDVAQDAYPFLPCGLLMKDRFDSRGQLASIACPVLAIHGDRDALVAPAHGRAMFAALSGPKEWYEVRAAGHNDLPWVAGEEYLRRIRAFLETHGLLR